jgi:hypothetical protein
MKRSRATRTDGLRELTDQTSTTTGSLLPQEPARRLLRRALELLGAGELGQPMIEILAPDEDGLRIAIEGLQAPGKEVRELETAATAASGTHAGTPRW